MSNNTFIRVDEVADMLGISKSYAYKIVRGLNSELKAKGFLVVSGRVIYRYTDWKGERKQSQKRGFATKKEAQAWEREQLNKTKTDLANAQGE